MESFDGITVLATNLRGNLDQAFARRLHFMIHFPDPDETDPAPAVGAPPRPAARWTRPTRSTSPASPPHLELAGGDIRNVVLSATFEAVRTGRAVGMAHLRARRGAGVRQARTSATRRRPRPTGRRGRRAHGTVPRAGQFSSNCRSPGTAGPGTMPADPALTDGRRPGMPGERRRV